MDENNGGTPNPLNQNPLDANPSEPMDAMDKTEPMEEINEVEINETNEIPVRQGSAPIREERPLTEELVEESVMVESLDPDGRPMEKLEHHEVAPKPRKKTGLIVGVIICLFVAVCCGVAAVLMMMMSGDKDPVATAMKKVMDGKMPANVAIDGKIEFLSNDPTATVSKIAIDLDAEAKTGAMINASNATVGITFANEEEVIFGFDEVATENGDLYFKVDGIAELLKQIELLSNPSTQDKCVEDETGQSKCEDVATNCAEDDLAVDCVEPEPFVIDDDAFGMVEMFSGVISIIDGQWLQISMDDFASMADGGMMDSDMSCMINMVGDVNTNSNSAAELYNKYPFVSSVAADVDIDSKYGQLRQIVVDDKEFASFVNSVQDSEMTSELYDCLGWNGYVQVTADDVAEILSELPAVYVEVDKDNNFSRLYFEAMDEESLLMTKVDLSFSYPATVNVSEPTEYTTFEEVIQAIFMSMYDLDGDVVEGEVVEGEVVEF